MNQEISENPKDKLVIFQWLLTIKDIQVNVSIWVSGTILRCVGKAYT